MSELLTAAQMRAIEMAAIESGEVTGLELMERAGRGVVEAIFEEWPELAEEHHGLTPEEAVDWGPAPKPPEYFEQDEGALRAVVLCGPGNNGGDGFVVARLLKERGWSVEVFLYGNAEKLPPDARVNYERWREMGEVAPMSAEQPWYATLYLDAGFGTGVTRAMPEDLYWALSVAHQSRLKGSKLVAIDQPSSVCTDSGTYFRPCYDEPYDLTVCFHRKKLCHYLADGPEASGTVRIVDIGLAGKDDPDWVEAVSYSQSSAQAFSKFHEQYKYSHGHALILSGGAGKSGAARLTARGALRIGAGLVTLGVPHEAQGEVAAQITAVMMREVGDAGALAKTLEDERLNALCLGPGLGIETARALVSVALETCRATVLDADALSAFADAPDDLFEMLHETCVLTPHEGEFKRLFPDIHAKLVEVPTTGPAYSKVDATREAAKQAGCVVLFKGPDTVIADPTGRCSINSAHYDRSAPWLATAGSGDVLAGFITGLLARGFAPMQAAETAAWLHVECALEFGPGLIAEDLPEMLPAVFRKLGL
ncbi:NAD(P)H-hydrate dehydratase [Shimia sediminis]|uniref:NAD(P)H-hydrate dehydratase n=1 Tax=Shimia sediminis TaxID=2497945 RepID=UPI000F8EE795|nr:NAD(P)H-hydrate dehydratase [Shimia sediminis]